MSELALEQSGSSPRNILLQPIKPLLSYIVRDVKPIADNSPQQFHLNNPKHIARRNMKKDNILEKVGGKPLHSAARIFRQCQKTDTRLPA